MVGDRLQTWVFFLVVLAIPAFGIGFATAKITEKSPGQVSFPDEQQINDPYATRSMFRQFSFIVEPRLEYVEDKVRCPSPPPCYVKEKLFYVESTLENNQVTDELHLMYKTKGYTTEREAMQEYIDHEGFLK